MEWIRKTWNKTLRFSSIYIMFNLLLFSKCQGHGWIRPEATYGPDYSVKHGVHVEGVTGKNRVIYDNDWFYDVLDAGYLVPKHKLGELDLRGIIVTADFFYQNGNCCKTIPINLWSFIRVDPLEKNNLISEELEIFKTMNNILMKHIQLGGMVPWQKPEN